MKNDTKILMEDSVASPPTASLPHKYGWMSTSPSTHAPLAMPSAPACNRTSWAMLAPAISPARQIHLRVPAGVRGHPSEGRHGVVVVRGERVLGREAVVHRHGKHAGAGHEGVVKVVVGGGEGRADDEAAAMDVDEWGWAASASCTSQQSSGRRGRWRGRWWRPWRWRRRGRRLTQATLAQVEERGEVVAGTHRKTRAWRRLMPSALVNVRVSERAHSTWFY